MVHIKIPTLEKYNELEIITLNIKKYLFKKKPGKPG